MRRLIHGSRWFSSTDGLGRSERNTIEDPEESNLLQQQTSKRSSSKGNKSIAEDYIWVVTLSWNGIRFEKRHSCPSTDENNNNTTNNTNSQQSYTRGGKRSDAATVTPSLATKPLVAVIVVLTIYFVVSIVDEGRPQMGTRADNQQQHEQQQHDYLTRERSKRDSSSSSPSIVVAANSIDPIDIWLRSPAFKANQFAPWTPKSEEEEGGRANPHLSSRNNNMGANLPRDVSQANANAEAPHSSADSPPSLSSSSSSSVLIPLVFTNPTRWYLRAPDAFGGGDDTELLEHTPLPTFGVDAAGVGVEEMSLNSTTTTLADELGAATTQHNNNNIMNEEERGRKRGPFVFPPTVAERPFFPDTLERINEGRHAIFSQLADISLRYYDAPALLEAYSSVARNQKRLGSQRRERRRRNNPSDRDDAACAAMVVNENAGHDETAAAAAAGREKHNNGKRYCRDRQHQLPIEDLRGDEDELPLPHRW